MARTGRPLAELTLSEDERETLVRWSRRSTSAQNLAQRCRIVLGCAGDILWVPGGEHGERDFPKVTAPPLDPDNRKEEW
jgi:hypothetical protein